MSRWNIFLLCSILSFLPMKGWGNNLPVVQTQVEERSQPDFSFPYQTYDFGKVRKNKKQHHTFVVTNTGTANLLILYISTGCGCTTTSYPKDPIPPGKKGKIKVSYDPTNQHTGPFRKSITIYFNSSKNYTRLFIKGDITDN